MPARNRHQLLALIEVHHPAQRVVQGRHRVDGPYRSAAAELFQGRQIRPGIGGRNRQDFQMQGFGQGLETGIGQRIGGDHITGLEHRHHRHRQAMLGAADDQHLFGRHAQPAIKQMTRDRSSLVQASRVGLIAQERFQVTGQGQLTQRRAQQVGLTGQ
ncbi:hypothetical protein D3C78_1546790 [compost metagenome]